ncbi:Hypothetical protein CINCED_3A024702 [Cinara cedri]|uniref:Fatty acyl-CoA reductase n=1 Tax=Cinara cedri TaxID=506608 RepID=A0A5E4MCJ6_9HEMI|nr:Hypothetical protein CINCED_3A024702 [Cinara cedri]
MPDTVDEPKSEIQQFFSGTNVFLTGATGIVGHVLVEKLLRTCYINKLYLLIRPKKNKEPQNRLNEMFSDSLFKRLAENQPNFTEKVVGIVGDCYDPNLGLSAEDEELLVANINVVIHCAATISFNETLKRACFINVRSTRDLLLMAQRMPNLKSFVYVSTAFSNPNESLIKEIIYNCHIKAETLIDIVENLPESIVTSITPQIIGKWPNTYTLSKAVAENLIKDYGKNMPISISRPCVVVFTQSDPIEGWATNMMSVPGLCVGVALGAIHVCKCKCSNTAVVMPADNVCNMIITTAWHASKPNSNDLVPVFNHTPLDTPPLSFGECMEYITNLIKKHNLSSEVGIWIPYVKTTDSRILYNILFFLYHYVPAFLGDIYLWCSGKKTKAVKLYKKLDVMMNEMEFFAFNEFRFDDTRLQELIASQSDTDKNLFNIEISNIVWEDYFLKSIIGFKRYILKENGCSPKAVQRYKKLWIAYYTLKTVYYGFLIYLISLILKYILY